MVKDLYLRSCHRKMRIGQEWLRKIWPPDSLQGFQRNGVIVRSVVQLDHVPPVVGVGS
ncbi:hypothetical protein QJS10_CPB21g00333 [Acorus calamus]|uniref:Uncharacterized protein n=1 Tax=Acorus calamus TaxID=4465 RepID=A0AAV9C2I0_ACOCL|nr:hypothetical protein QJS10_CPB21g00333 [Acorus calamus]